MPRYMYSVLLTRRQSDRARLNMKMFLKVVGIIFAHNNNFLLTLLYAFPAGAAQPPSLASYQKLKIKRE